MKLLNPIAQHMLYSIILLKCHCFAKTPKYNKIIVKKHLLNYKNIIKTLLLNIFLFKTEL